MVGLICWPAWAPAAAPHPTTHPLTHPLTHPFTHPGHPRRYALARPRPPLSDDVATLLHTHPHNMIQYDTMCNPLSDPFRPSAEELLRHVFVTEFHNEVCPTPYLIPPVQPLSSPYLAPI